MKKNRLTPIFLSKRGSGSQAPVLTRLKAFKRRGIETVFEVCKHCVHALFPLVLGIVVPLVCIWYLILGKEVNRSLYTSSLFLLHGREIGNSSCSRSNDFIKALNFLCNLKNNW